ncbi:MAG: efflux transporter outer membrane subunit [Thermoguttaceae bacterium]
MLRLSRPGAAVLSFALSVILFSGGCCTGLRQYVQNGFKVGPNYCTPPAPVADRWIDAPHIPAAGDPQNICRWWTVFNDPKLNELVACAYRQNLSLREAGFRVLQARAQLAIVRGELFPQSQTAFGDYRRVGGAGAPFANAWDYGFRMQWELDFWGRLRRAVTEAGDNLDATVADYDNVLVTLLSDVASNYVRIRTDQERIRLLQANVELQRGVLKYVNDRLAAGFHQTPLDSDQALSNLRQTEAGVPLLEIDVRQSEDALCVLLGMPTVDLQNLIGAGPIPTSPPQVAIGVPCDLLRRRPDVRQAERLAAAQAEQIGIAEAQLYPVFTVNGTMGYAASSFRDLFKSSAFNGSVGPSFQWNVLNYGRIVNDVRFQNARFQELVAAYQRTVLQANADVEDGLVTFLQSQRRARLLDESVAAAERAVKMVLQQYQTGSVDFNRYVTIEQNMVTQQDAAAQAHGQIAQGLISTYRALGGGWELRLSGDPGVPQSVMAGPAPGEPQPTPPPVPAPPAAPTTQPTGHGAGLPPPPNLPIGEQPLWPGNQS